jgi:hypothetical protein
MRPLNLAVFALFGVLLAGMFASAATAATWDDDIVLPASVANPMHRTEQSLNAAKQAIASGDTAKAVSSLKAVRGNVIQANNAARAQMTAQPTDPESETPPGPDSVEAVLTQETTVATRLAGMLNGKRGMVVDGISPALRSTVNVCDSLVSTVTALDPEGSGGDYADGMSDILPDFDSEVATLQADLNNEQLSAGGRSVLAAALDKAKKTQAKMTAAYGGGE